MRKNKNIVLRSVCGAPFLIAEDSNGVEMDQLIALNETATFIWEALPDDEDIDVDAIVQKLTAEYDVTAEEAHSNIDELLNKMLQAGVVE